MLAAIGAGFASAPGARLLTAAPHADADHDRAVFTLAGPPGALADALAGRRARGRRPDRPRASTTGCTRTSARSTSSPSSTSTTRGAARPARRRSSSPTASATSSACPSSSTGCSAAGARAPSSAAAGRPRSPSGCAPASSRRTSGPPSPHPTAGAVLVAARPPLVAFNLELAPPATLDDARRIAALVREGGPEGLPGVRAIGLELAHRGGVAQVSTNVEDHRAVPLAALLEAVARHAPVARGGARRASRRAPPSTAGRDGRPGRGPARRSRTPSRLDPTMAQTKKKRSHQASRQRRRHRRGARAHRPQAHRGARSARTRPRAGKDAPRRDRFDRPPTLARRRPALADRRRHLHRA